MAGKNFWNWIGLPCQADIASIQESCRNQEKQISAIAESDAELLNLLVEVRSELSSIVGKMETSNMQIVQAAEHNILDVLRNSDINTSRLISEQVNKLSGILERFQTDVCVTVSQLKDQQAQLMERLNVMDNHFAHMIEGAQAEMATITDKLELGYTETVRGTEQSILDAIQVSAMNLERIQKEYDSAIVQMKDEQTRLSQQLKTVDEKAFTLMNMLRQLRESDTKSATGLTETLSGLVSAASNQGELIRLLIANSLMDNLSEFR